jgi:hypothetical protein
MSPRVVQRRRRLAVRLTVAALVWSLGLLLAALLVPVYNGQTISNANGLTLTTGTLVQVDGAKVLIPVVLPGLLTLLAAAAMRERHRRGAAWSTPAAAALVFLVFALALVSILSIGVFVLPVAALLALALWLTPAADQASGSLAVSRAGS